MNPPAALRVPRVEFLLPVLTAGIISGVIAAVLQISFAALIFSGDLSSSVSRGTGFLLFGGIAFALVVALTSSFEGSVASPQDAPAAILALIATSIAVTVPERSTGAVYPTVVAAIILSSLATGIFFLLLGRFKLGRFVRYVPYPVIGGFLAGTGWLLAQGGINVMTNAQLTPEWIYYLTRDSIYIRWVPGLLLAVFLLVLLRRSSNPLITPLVLGGAIALFYGILFVTDTPVAVASARGWLLGPFPRGALWQPISPEMFQFVDWPTLLRQADKIAVLLIVCVVALLLNASGIELAVRHDIDFNRELEAAGAANLAAALGGGAPGYHLLGATVLSYKLEARGRLIGLTAAAVIAFVLFVGYSILEFFPKPVIGGLLIFLGLSFLIEWVFDAAFKLPRSDYILVLIILVVVAAFGFLPGVAVGLVIALLLFAFNYSRANVVRHTLTGITFRSNVDRPASQRTFLRAHGDELYIIQLQGFVFFGTAQTLLNQIRTRVQDSKLPPVRFIVLDFFRVIGLDSSAVSSFVRLEHLTEAHHLNLVLTQLPPLMEQQLKHGGMTVGADHSARIMPTMDHGIEWCENQILAQADSPLSEAPESLEHRLGTILPPSTPVSKLMQYLERIEIPEGYLLIRQGAHADALYLLDSGLLSVHLQMPDGKPFRLRTIRSGSVVGEVAMYSEHIRTASVVAAEPCVLYRLTSDSIIKMEQEDPQLAAAFHKWIASLIAERLSDSGRTLEAVLD